jgi:hypothetical protein
MEEVTIDFVAPWTKYVAERSAPRYDAICNQIYGAKRVFGPNTILLLRVIADRYDILFEEEDELPSAAETILYPGFNAAPAKDHDDSTCSRVGVSTQTTIDVVLWDFGIVKERWIYLNVSTHPANYTHVMISTDCTTFTTAYSMSGSSPPCGIATFRCLKLRVVFTSPTVLTWDLCSAEAYPPVSRKRVTIPAAAAKLVRCLVRSGYSQLLEVGEIWVD